MSDKDLKIFTDNIEGEAINQIYNLLSYEPFENAKVRIMPDVHSGKGCVIGFTANLGDKVIPNIVGVDIGCGMLCINLGNIDIDLEHLDEIIHTKIPSGFSIHSDSKFKFNDLESLYCYSELKNAYKFNNGIGTLGGGNHFIEVDKDDDNNKYLVIHSGSRNLGNQVANYYQDLAIKNCSQTLDDKLKNIINTLREQKKFSEIEDAKNELKKSYKYIPKELCYLQGELRDKYLHDMRLCQDYAKLNRDCIAKLILNELFDVKTTSNLLSQSFQTVHNYIGDDNIVRKGAISAYKDEIVLIPINMRDGSIIAKGKGNIDWNCSAPHGAGRLMSRSTAKQQISLEEFENCMSGIYSTSVKQSTLDESPMAYKPMQEIIDNIKDTVDIIKIIKPIYNFKAS